MLGYRAARLFLHTKDGEVRMTLQTLTIAARAVQQQHDRERAREIANAVGKMLGG